MALGGGGNENEHLHYLKDDEEEDDDQLIKCDQEGKLYINGRQFISPQRLKIIQAELEKQGENPLVTVLFDSTKKDIDQPSGTSNIKSTCPIDRVSMSREVVSPTKNVTDYPWPSTTSTFQIDKIPMPREDLGFADIDTSIPTVSVESNQENNRITERAGTSGEGAIQIKVVINSPINGTLAINGQNFA